MTNILMVITPYWYRGTWVFSFLKSIFMVELGIYYNLCLPVQVFEAILLKGYKIIIGLIQKSSLFCSWWRRGREPVLVLPEDAI
jgi:hypothetical protein